MLAGRHRERLFRVKLWTAAVLVAARFIYEFRRLK
jgi:hypothetical protein